MDKGILKQFIDIIEEGNQICDKYDALEAEYEELNKELKEKDSTIRLLQRHLQLDIEGLEQENKMLRIQISKLKNGDYNTVNDNSIISEE